MLIKCIQTAYRKLTNPQAKCTVVILCTIILFILAGTTYVISSIVFADTSGSLEELNFGIALPHEKCRVRPLSNWSDAEKWAWKKICENEVVNFNEYLSEDLSPINPNHDDKWLNKRRILSTRFLNTILFHEPFHNAIPHQGVRIAAAYIQGELDLTDAVLERPLVLIYSIFNSRVDMYRLTTPTLVSFDGSRFDGALTMDSVSIGGSLHMRNSMGLANVDLSAAKISNNIDMNGSIFKGELNMNAVSVEGSLLMQDRARFRNVDLYGAKIGGQLSMVGSTFTGNLEMTVVSIGGSLHMRDGANFNNVDLSAAKISNSIIMSGSKFKGELNMNVISVEGSLLMRDRAKFNNVNLQGAKIGGQLSMVGSTFTGNLEMATVSIGDSLQMQDGAKFNSVDLRVAQVGNDVEIFSSTFMGKLDMGLLSVGNGLFMNNADFIDVNLGAAKIGNILDMRNSTFTGVIHMNLVSVGNSVFMSGANFMNVELAGAKIGNIVSMADANFKGELDMKSAFIGGSLIMGKARFANLTNLTFLSVGSNLEIQGTVLRRLNLTGARIEQTLRLSKSGVPNIEWKKYELEDKTLQSPKLTLKNAKVDVLQDNKNSWPDQLERSLEGFTYNHLAAPGLNGQEMPHQRGSDWFIDWLNKADETYSPQPYKQLAGVLRTAGLEEMANDILFASRERMRRESSWCEAKWWILGALKIFIGYGYGGRIFLVLAWIVGFVAAGTLILHISKERGRHYIFAGPPC